MCLYSHFIDLPFIKPLRLIRIDLRKSWSGPQYPVLVVKGDLIEAVL